jgi:hypothetical protein
MLGVKAVLIYPIFKPWNLTISYIHYFDRVGDPVEWPYIRTANGGRISVQPMVSQGEKLTQMIQNAGQWGFEVNNDLTRVRFDSRSPIFAGSQNRKRQAVLSGRRIFEGRSERSREQLEDFSEIERVPRDTRPDLK